MSVTMPFLDRYWATPELTVAKTGVSVCARCNSIRFAGFRTASMFDEMFRPTTFFLGDFPTLSISAFSGCPICRLVVRLISQSATSLYHTVRLNEIAKVGLRLNLDDELSLHCWASDGSVYPLLGRDALEIRMQDSKSDTDAPGLCQEYKWMELQTPMEMKILENCQDNRFIPDPKIDPDLAKSWLVTCSIFHETCSDWMDASLDSKDIPLLPTRVLRLDLKDGVRVIEPEGKRSQYITLSHCWGQSQHSYKLNQRNKASMMAEIDLKELPKTFREAAMITMRMGFKYLWIDSMCIIQPTTGDFEDWEKEGPCMAQYYRNSVFTIAASAGLDSDWGCLFRAPSSQYQVQPWPLFKEPVQREWDEFSLIMNRDPAWLPIVHPQPCSWLWQVQNCPLNSRAWVLQERLLSKRILHCTLQGLMWECPKLRASETEPLGCQYDYDVRNEGLLQLDEAVSKGASFVTGRYWRQVVERFSRLDITHVSDRLPALAGLAQAIQEEAEDRYIVGLWARSFIPSLLWFRIHNAGGPGPSRLPGGPSWTWASTSGPVKFTSLDKLDYPQRDVDRYNITAELLEVTTHPATSNVFSWVSSSSLRIRGCLRAYDQGGGCPEMKPINKSDADCWYGYSPSEFRDEGGSVTNIFIDPIPDEDEGPVPEDVALQMAEVVSDHDLLYSYMKSEVSQAFEGHEIEPSAKAKEDKPDALTCVFDSPDNHGQDNLFLFEVLREIDGDEHPHVSEGLVLTPVQGGGMYKRTGFFTSSTKRPLFAGLDSVEIELN